MRWKMLTLSFCAFSVSALSGTVLAQTPVNLYARGAQGGHGAVAAADAAIVAIEHAAVGKLDEAAQAFPRPAWLGREVTDEVRYYNVNLARHPYVHWSDSECNAC